MKSKQKPAIEIVLRALNLGLQVKLLDGYTYLMQDDEIGILLTNETTGEELFGVCDMSLNYFLKQVNSMSYEALTLLSFSSALSNKVSR